MISRKRAGEGKRTEDQLKRDAEESQTTDSPFSTADKTLLTTEDSSETPAPLVEDREDNGKKEI